MLNRLVNGAGLLARRIMLAKITIAASLVGVLTLAVGVPTAMAASRTPGSAHSTAAVAKAAQQPGQVTCVPLQSSKGQRLEHCSVAVALSEASSARLHGSVPFSVKYPVSTAAFRSSLPANAPDTTAAVSGGCRTDPVGNQTCTWSLNPGPRQACGGFNGNIQWFIDDWGMAWITTWGEVWSLCAATAYVYLAWNQADGAARYNDDAGSASAYSTSGVNAIFNSNGFGGPSSVHETVCTTEDGGWRCGAGVYAQ
jgi:hypothetical protein